MKVTVVTDGNSVVGYQIADKETPAPGQFRGGLIAGDGQKLHELEVPEDSISVSNPEETHKKLAAHLGKKVA
jgi:hypothetical protein